MHDTFFFATTETEENNLKVFADINKTENRYSERQNYIQRYLRKNTTICNECTAAPPENKEDYWEDFATLPGRQKDSSLSRFRNLEQSWRKIVNIDFINF